LKSVHFLDMTGMIPYHINLCLFLAIRDQ